MPFGNSFCLGASFNGKTIFVNPRNDIGSIPIALYYIQNFYIMDNLEKIVTDTILQRAADVITIDGKEYPIASPTPATLILISEQVSTMPDIDKDAKDIVCEVLGKAKDFSVIGHIAAILILGAKRIKEHRIVESTYNVIAKKWSWKKFRYVMTTETLTKKAVEVDYLAERILDEVTNGTLCKLISKRLYEMQLTDFFVLTTSLSGANLLKRTREVETAFGD